MKPTRVVVMLAGGGWQSCYFPSQDEASAYIAAWTKRHIDRVNEGRVNEVETTVWTADLPDRPGRMGFAALGQYIIGMYIVPDERTAADRMADVMEKCHNDGEEWRGE